MQVGVQNFVLISTDKAVRPTNVMGSTKRPAEMVLQALSNESAPVLFGDRKDVHHVNKTRFTMVRFGKRPRFVRFGHSAVPRADPARGPVTVVTHPSITRYFMTTFPRQRSWSSRAGSMGQGGDVFPLDMGPPVKILELAENDPPSGLSVRSERSPHGDIAIEFSGCVLARSFTKSCWTVNESHRPSDDHAGQRGTPELGGLHGASCWSSRWAAVEKDDYSRVRQWLRKPSAAMRLTVKSSTGSIARGGGGTLRSHCFRKRRPAAFCFLRTMFPVRTRKRLLCWAVDPGAFHGDKVVSWMGMKPPTRSFIPKCTHAPNQIRSASSCSPVLRFRLPPHRLPSPRSAGRNDTW